MRKTTLALLLVFLIVLFGVSSVRAQEDVSNNQEASESGAKMEDVEKPELKGGEEATNEAEEVANEAETSRIFYKSRNTQQIINLRNLYRDQIEAYRNSEKAFTIAKTHYFNIETLVALEEAVDATELVMKNRAKVLITYLELLSETLDETAGVELALEEESLKQIDDLIIELRLHQENIIIVEDRVGVNTLADEFEPFVERYNNVAYRALSLIRIGQIQAVYDVATIIDEDIREDKKDDEVGAIVQNKRDRAYQEIQRNFLMTNENLAKLNNKIIISDQEGFVRSFYNKILQELEPAYIQISKSLNHLEELLKL